MKVLARARRWLTRLLASIGLLTVIVLATPLDTCWVRVYSGKIGQPTGDILILLSAAADDQGGISYSSYWRARYALLAWQRGGFKKIVISGGGGPGIENFLLAQGIPRDCLIAEWQSNSTRENGMEAARILNAMPGRKVLLTSDFHMFRAVRTFRKLGVDVTPMAVPDVLQISEHWHGRIPAFQTLGIESTKILYYRLRGWI